MPVDHRATRAVRYHFGAGDAGETAIGIGRGQSVEPAAYGGILLRTHHCPVVVPNDRELGKKQALARIIARDRGADEVAVHATMTAIRKIDMMLDPFRWLGAGGQPRGTATP